jgi:ElaB/YqjD/DUF883 family membrane-anchored ribosome-binding protein
MFRQSSYARMTNEMSELAKRTQMLERRLERIGGRAASQASSTFSRTTDGLGETLASVFGQVADQFRNGSRSVGVDPAQLAQDAAKIGNDALRRISHEVEHRPLVMLAVAAGVGFLAGLAGRRH